MNQHGRRPRAGSLWPQRHNRQRPKATFEVNLYLVPQHPERVPAGTREAVLRTLERGGVVGSYYDLGLGWLAPGPQANRLFPTVPPDVAPFEYAIVWEGEPEFVPNAHMGPFGARCSCGAELDDGLHAFIEAQSAGAAARDARIHCACGAAVPLAALTTDIPTAITGLYVNFCHVDCTELDPSLIEELGALVGSPLRVLHERL